MLIAIAFLLGIANFALDKAVLASRHPLFADSSRAPFHGIGRFTLLVEFGVLALALAFAFQAAAWAAVAYGIYTAANALAAWLILSRRL